MLFVRYGDPLWVERNMRSCKTIKDYYMGTDANGYPRFKSSYYGGLIYEKTTMGGGDTGYNARTMKRLLWSAWQGNPEARDLFVRWAEGWRVATMAQIDDKLPGVVPQNIWYPSGDIKAPMLGVKWWDSKWNYYGGLDYMIWDSFLNAYNFTHDEKFLEPIRLGMEMATRGPLAKSWTEGTVEWQIHQMAETPGQTMGSERLSTYRLLTGDTAYDEYIMRFADQTHAYRINGDLDAYTKGIQKTAEEPCAFRFLRFFAVWCDADCRSGTFWLPSMITVRGCPPPIM
jgi:hypothetical protein